MRHTHTAYTSLRTSLRRRIRSIYISVSQHFAWKFEWNWIRRADVEVSKLRNMILPEWLTFNRYLLWLRVYGWIFNNILTEMNLITNREIVRISPVNLIYYWSRPLLSRLEIIVLAIKHSCLSMKKIERFWFDRNYISHELFVHLFWSRWQV